MENQSTVTGRVIGCAITVHRILGPRLRESVYEESLALEFLEQRIAFERQVSVPIQYKGHWVGHYQIDFIIEREVVVEVKSIDQYHPIFEAQMLAYLRARVCTWDCWLISTHIASPKACGASSCSDDSTAGGRPQSGRQRG